MQCAVYDTYGEEGGKSLIERVKGKVTMDAIPLMFLGEGYQNHNTSSSIMSYYD
jgi:hypothetical protein